MRLREEQMTRIKREARRQGRTPSEVAALLIEEGLRREEFAFIDFRNSPVGRQAYVQGSSLAVWEVIMIAQSYGHDPAATANHLRWPLIKVKAAFNYAAANSKEIEDAIADNDAVDFAKLSAMLPQATQFVVSDPGTGGGG
jgi:hypothetical protein